MKFCTVSYFERNDGITGCTLRLNQTYSEAEKQFKSLISRRSSNFEKYGKLTHTQRKDFEYDLSHKNPVQALDWILYKGQPANSSQTRYIEVLLIVLDDADFQKITDKFCETYEEDKTYVLNLKIGTILQKIDLNTKSINLEDADYCKLNEDTFSK